MAAQNTRIRCDVVAGGKRRRAGSDSGRGGEKNAVTSACGFRLRWRRGRARVGAMTEPGEEHTPHKEPPGALPPDYDDDLEDDDDLFETATEVTNECRCGECCRNLIIEVDLEDAKREPKIAERGSPIYASADLTESGQRELEGYYLYADVDIK